MHPDALVFASRPVVHLQIELVAGNDAEEDRPAIQANPAKHLAGRHPPEVGQLIQDEAFE
jgi:hypothetical protein